MALPPSPPDAATAPVIRMQGICTRFGDKVVHDQLDLEVRKGEIFALVGGSGSGKSTLLREMILLQRPDAGTVNVLGLDLHTANAAQALALRLRFGVLFQQGGLFGSLTVLENVGLPLREHRKLPSEEIDAIAARKIALSGLPPEAGAQYPASLSGGMLKRAALARALALDPELLFLDEPTAGLDPASADGLDLLIQQLQGEQGLTVVMVTHDLDLLWHAADRVAVLADGRVQGLGSMQELSTLLQPAVQTFFTGPRAQAAQQQYQQPPYPTGDSTWKPR
ncbi:ABC transporter ATP-binding protein [Rhodoferax lacus]|uniref:ABC transporter ATP-binding protein n=1 Tax=Rhodoferax lacus TaxID=2184758 RepID=A0A3E1RDI2_9BURK|nr:ATP-binding cassette domain-containing protein [Rhodoferax lacus]RFO97419.1 ABC transporter ATP-binding protein [Rhodoferax lacus]